MGAESLFDSLNSYDETLAVIESNSAKDLQSQIRSIRLPTRIIAIYAVGETHYAWLQTIDKKIVNKK